MHSVGAARCRRTGDTPPSSNTRENALCFDAGNDPTILARNAKARVDLSKLDFVVMSHRHSDHMGGLAYVLKVNPSVKIYAPKEGFGVYGRGSVGKLLSTRYHSCTRRAVL
jgi:metal-dependent hydrolase (beta-lactamase superfamily II)